MTVIVTSDEAKGAGHALIRVAGAGTVMDGRFRIARPPDWPEPNLGPRGWQGSETLLLPDEISGDGADLVLAVGPEVCGFLEPDNYYFALPAAGVNGAVTWPEIEEVHGGLDAYFAARAKPAPSVTMTPAPPVVEDQRPPAPPPVPLPPPAPTPARPWAAIGGGLLLLLLAAGGGAWYVLHRPEPTPTPVPTPAPPPEPPPPQPPPPQPPAQLDTMPVPALVARNDPAEMLDQAQKRLATKPQDSLLLLEAAGEDRHYGPALTQLAQLYDPGKPRQGGIPADPRQAAKYYRDADRAGDHAGTADREALHRALIAKRDAGDVQAKLTEQDFWP